MLMKAIMVLLMAVLLTASVSAFAIVNNWNNHAENNFVSTHLSLDISDLQSDAGLKVAFTIPELGIRATKGPFTPSNSLHTNIYRSLVIPLDTEPGEYVIRMYITDKEGNKRIRHRFVVIE